MDESRDLYAQQMEQWFNEQKMLTEQLQRTIIYHEDVAALNRVQLELHRKRIALASEEHEAWLKEAGLF